MPANSALPPASKKSLRPAVCGGCRARPAEQSGGWRGSSQAEQDEPQSRPGKLPGDPAPDEAAAWSGNGAGNRRARASLQAELLRPQDSGSWRNEVAARVRQLPGTQASPCTALPVVAAEVRPSRAVMDRSSGTIQPATTQPPAGSRLRCRILSRFLRESNRSSRQTDEPAV